MAVAQWCRICSRHMPGKKGWRVDERAVNGNGMPEQAENGAAHPASDSDGGAGTYANVPGPRPADLPVPPSGLGGATVQEPAPQQAGPAPQPAGYVSASPYGPSYGQAGPAPQPAGQANPYAGSPGPAPQPQAGYQVPPTSTYQNPAYYQNPSPYQNPQVAPPYQQPVPYQAPPAAPVYQAPPAPRRQGKGTGRLIVSILLTIGIFVSSLLFLVPVYSWGWDENMTFELGCALVAVVCVCLMGGAKMLRPSLSSFLDVLRLGLPIIISSAVIMVLQVWEYMADGQAVSANWAWWVGYYAVFCLGVGILEECALRGVLLNGLLARFGGTRRGLVASVLVAAVLFGMLHIEWGTLDYSSGLELVQALLKIAQTGTYAVVLSAVSIRTRNLTGVALYHALDDFLVMVVPYAIFTEDLDLTYVSSSESEAWSTIIVYLILIAIYLPSFIKAMKQISNFRVPERGCFVKEQPAVAGTGGPYAGPYGQQPGAAPYVQQPAAAQYGAYVQQPGAAPYAQQPYYGPGTVPGPAPYGQQPNPAPGGGVAPRMEETASSRPE